MQQYVAGFVFDPTGAFVALIKKEKPEWQKGRLNAIGGKIEEGEEPIDAQVREFREETGVEIPATDWQQICKLLCRGPGDPCEVFFFVAHSALVFSVSSPTAEQVRVYRVSDLNMDEGHVHGTLPNLRWLIPMAKYWQYLNESRPYTIYE